MRQGQSALNLLRPYSNDQWTLSPSLSTTQIVKEYRTEIVRDRFSTSITGNFHR